MKALDIVKTPKGGIAFITETNDDGQKASINYINGLNIGHEHNAWWDKEELEVIDSIPRLLAGATCHPFGDGKADVVKFFKIYNE
ncbi:hypothetical protein LCGC14_0938350 [marine sediment metagenome]|uniref:Uncharacterized protein n=1 Tax=marine sediment metagenome TaxID=412755 RepID=A0A0F9R4F6_9ZZZZ